MFENALPTNEGVRFSLGKNNESLTNGKASESGQPTQKGASLTKFNAKVSKNLKRAKKMLQLGEHTADILCATDLTLRNGEWKYREKKCKRYITNYDLSKD